MDAGNHDDDDDDDIPEDEDPTTDEQSPQMLETLLEQEAFYRDRDLPVPPSLSELMTSMRTHGMDGALISLFADE